MTEDRAQRPMWARLLLAMLPLWLLASGGVAVWFALHREENLAAAEQERFVTTVSVPMIADDLKKLVEIIGERNGASDSAAKNLGRAAAMIEGLLGPSNTGYRVQRVNGPAAWPLLHVAVAGKHPEKPAVWVLASYDSRPGSRGAEANASGLAATLAASQALAGDHPHRAIHFVFLPHANDPDSPVVETASMFREMAGSPHAVLCVEAMGSGNDLWLSSRDTEAMPLSLAAGLGTVRGAETVCLGDDADPASVLFEMGLPAVRVATRAQVTAAEADDQTPSAAKVAASAGRLVELIRRCAAAP